MTYADLRQRNRLQEDTHNSQRTRYPQSPPQRPAGSPPTPQYPNPPTPPTPSPSQPVPGGGETVSNNLISVLIFNLT